MSKPESSTATVDAAVDKYDRLLSRFATSGFPPLIIAVGLSDHLLEALDRHNAASKVLAVEPAPALARQATARPLWRSWMDAGRLTVLVGPDYGGYADAWRLIAGDAQPPMIVDPELLQKFPSQTEGAKAVAKQIVRGARANQEARKRFAGGYLLNTLANLPVLASEADAAALTDLFTGIPAIVVGAGPSLDENLPVLRHLQDRALLVAVDTAVRPLLAAGIHPHLVVSVDPGDANAQTLERPARRARSLVRRRREPHAERVSAVRRPDVRLQSQQPRSLAVACRAWCRPREAADVGIGVDDGVRRRASGGLRSDRICGIGSRLHRRLAVLPEYDLRGGLESVPHECRASGRVRQVSADEAACHASGYPGRERPPRPTSFSSEIGLWRKPVPSLSDASSMAPAPASCTVARSRTAISTRFRSRLFRMRIANCGHDSRAPGARPRLVMLRFARISNALSPTAPRFHSSSGTSSVAIRPLSSGSAKRFGLPLRDWLSIGTEPIPLASPTSNERCTGLSRAQAEFHVSMAEESRVVTFDFCVVRHKVDERLEPLAGDDGATRL